MAGFRLFEKISNWPCYTKKVEKRLFSDFTNFGPAPTKAVAAYPTGDF